MASREQVRERDFHRCARCGSAQDLHVHHRVLRSQGGQDNYANLVTLCAKCHHWVHNNVRTARDAGWLVRPTSRPAEVAIRHFSWPAGVIWLNHDGTVSLVREDEPRPSPTGAR